MENDKIIIVGLVIVVVALLVGIVLIQEPQKESTKLTIKVNSTVQKGDNLVVKLTNLNGTPLENMKVNVIVMDESSKSVKDQVLQTDSKGKVKMKLDIDAGKYEVEVFFNGDDKYNESKAVDKFTIEEVEVSQPTQSSSNLDGYRYSDQAGAYIKEYTTSDGIQHADYADGRSQYYDPDTNTMYLDDGKGNVEAMEW